MNLLGKIRNQSTKIAVSLAALLAAAALNGQTWADPGISFNSNGNTHTINVSQNQVINWQTFNIGQGETVNFNFSGGATGVLNRVTGEGISTISGTLNANRGTVILVNQHGIVFGVGATINVPTFIASTYDISEDSFRNKLQYGGCFALTGSDSGSGIVFSSNLHLLNSTKLTAIGNVVRMPGITISAVSSPRDSFSYDGQLPQINIVTSSYMPPSGTAGAASTYDPATIAKMASQISTPQAAAALLTDIYAQGGNQSASLSAAVNSCPLTAGTLIGATGAIDTAYSWDFSSSGGGLTQGAGAGVSGVVVSAASGVYGAAFSAASGGVGAPILGSATISAGSTGVVITSLPGIIVTAGSPGAGGTFDGSSLSSSSVSVRNLGTGASGVPSKAVQVRP